MEVDYVYSVLVGGRHRIDADAFQRDVGAKFGGSVGSRKRMRDGVVESGPKYWTSRMIPIESGDPEDKLVELLTQLNQSQ